MNKEFENMIKCNQIKGKSPWHQILLRLHKRRFLNMTFRRLSYLWTKIKTSAKIYSKDGGDEVDTIVWNLLQNLNNYSDKKSKHKLQHSEISQTNTNAGQVSSECINASSTINTYNPNISVNKTASTVQHNDAESSDLQDSPASPDNHDSSDRADNEDSGNSLYNDDSRNSAHNQDTRDSTYKQDSRGTVYNQNTGDGSHTQDFRDGIHQQHSPDTVDSQDTGDGTHKQNTPNQDFQNSAHKQIVFDNTKIKVKKEHRANRYDDSGSDYEPANSEFEEDDDIFEEKIEVKHSVKLEP